MDTVMITLCAAVAVAAVLCVYFAFGAVAARRSAADARAGRDVAERLAAEREAREVSLVQQLDARSQHVTGLTAEVARAESRIEALTAQRQHDREELEKLQASFRLEFRHMANEILEEKSTQFKKTNREAMDVVLKPFKENLSDFKERVEKIYSDENRQRGALHNEIRNLQELNRRITEETVNLTNALRGNSKVQGDWGEMILETILERSNLVRGIHYEKQVNVKDEAGNNLRPDFILNMPDGKRLVIDSKVSLTAYLALAESELEEDRQRHLAAHVRSVRNHVTELGRVAYQQNVAGSPDFVIMFIPTEAAFLAAMQADAEIYNDAYARQVIVSSPTNLTGILMVVHDLWKRDNQSRNAMEIADEGAKLYDKFAGFVSTLESVGKGIQSASDNYDKAMTQLRTGSGNLVGRAEKLRRLGVRASKALPNRLLSEEEE